MNFLKERNVWIKLASILIAVFLWSYVLLTDNPPKTQSFPNLEVQAVGVESLADRSLTLVSTETPKITLRLTGTSQDMAQLTASDIQVTVDLSNIQEAGVYYLQPNITVDGDVRTTSYEPRRVQITVENVVSKEVPVQVTSMNSLPSSRLLGDMTPASETLQITGAESVVNTVGYALLTVDLAEVSADTTQTCRVALYTENDTQVDSPLVSPARETMDVDVQVNHVATVPLGVSLTPSETLTADQVQAEISPTSVRVYGSQQALAELESLSLGSIDLATVTRSGQKVTLPIELPTGVSLMDGQPDEATVTLTIQQEASQTEQQATRTLEVTQITLEDTSENPPEVTLNTQSVRVTVAGTQEAVDAVTADDLTVTARFDSASLGAGTHEVTAQAAVSRAGVTVQGGEVTVSITIAQSAPEETPAPPQEEQEEAPEQS